MPQKSILEKLVDDTLLAALDPGVKERVDRALAAGATAAQILRTVRRATGQRNLTVLAVEAYLESLS